MNCSEVQEILSAYYDNELSAELRAEVAEHIDRCGACFAELANFENLSSMAADLEQPETPASVWTAIRHGLDEARGESEAPAELAQRELRPPEVRTRRTFLQFTAVIAATVLIGFVGWTLWHNYHEQEAMAKAMEQVAADINSDYVTTLLLNKFGGSEVSYQDAITQVGFRPVASEGMPAGYTVESIHVLDMPCCKCTQTACRRSDNSRFFIYEHENEEPGWFEHRRRRTCECGGTTCKVVDLDNQLAAIWQIDNRYVTVLGVRDEEEIALLVRQFEDKS